MRVIWVLKERSGQRVDQHECKVEFSISHLIHFAVYLFCLGIELLITVHKLITAPKELVLNLLDQPFDCGVNSSQCSIVEL